jgi:hypothetical protein
VVCLYFEISFWTQLQAFQCVFQANSDAAASVRFSSKSQIQKILVIPIIKDGLYILPYQNKYRLGQTRHPMNQIFLNNSRVQNKKGHDLTAS